MPSSERKKSIFHDHDHNPLTVRFYACLNRNAALGGLIFCFAAVIFVMATLLGNDGQHVQYDQLILFGDSLLQRSMMQEDGFAFGAQVADDYLRKLDVVNRGFNGYTSAQALHVLPKVMPRRSQARIRILVIFLGANDAALEDYHTGQHIPLDAYKHNLAQIVNHPILRPHNPRIMLITPPPVNEHALLEYERAHGKQKIGRTAEGVKAYAQACVDVARDLDVPVLDIWSLMMEEAGWHSQQLLFGSLKQQSNTKLNEFLSDGLHFTPKGYHFLHERFRVFVAQQWPDQTPEALEDLLPLWQDAFPAPVHLD